MPPLETTRYHHQLQQQKSSSSSLHDGVDIVEEDLFLEDFNDAATSSCSTTTTSSESSSSSLSLLPVLTATSSSIIGGYRFKEPDPDDPFAEEHDPDGGEIIPCSVVIDGNFQHYAAVGGFLHDKVQKFRFDDFDGLPEFMSTNRAGIEANDELILKQVHERFRTIIQDHILTNNNGQKKFYASVLGTGNDDEAEDHPDEEETETKTHHQVALYATPNVRLGRGRYAGFLHSDSTFTTRNNNNKSHGDGQQQCNSISGSSSSSSSSSLMAMINIWICLNDIPPNNQLAFCQLPREYTRLYGGKLVAQHEYIGHTSHTATNTDDATPHTSPRTTTLVYDETMCWGSFFCFVAGESNQVKEVLLHGAVDVVVVPTPGKKNEGGERKHHRHHATLSNKEQQGTMGTCKTPPPQRKSVEFRYVV